MKLSSTLLMVWAFSVLVACGGNAEDSQTPSVGDGDRDSALSRDADATPAGDGDSPEPIAVGDGDGDLVVGDGEVSMGGSPGDGDWVISPPPQMVQDGSVGHVRESCGAFLTAGEDPGPDPIDCTANGDMDALCVFSNHCWCSEGFTCAEQVDDPISSPECPERVACIPVP